jgi:hypothetical protein
MGTPGLSAAKIAKPNGYPGLARSVDCAPQWIYRGSENKYDPRPTRMATLGDGGRITERLVDDEKPIESKSTMTTCGA